MQIESGKLSRIVKKEADSLSQFHNESSFYIGEFDNKVIRISVMTIDYAVEKYNYDDTDPDNNCIKEY